jgi:predicted nucleic acid-binding protein
MVIYYLDTSAAVKLYVPEAGSDWLHNLLDANPEPLLLSSLLLRIEMQSAFARRLREGSVTPGEYADMCHLFDVHRAARYRLSPVEGTVVQQACTSIERYPLRAYDAVHLATALLIHWQLLDAGASALVFLSADDRLIAAAATEGLAVDNPNDHP